MGRIALTVLLVLVAAGSVGAASCEGQSTARPASRAESTNAREDAPTAAEPCEVIERIEIWKASRMLRAYCTDGGVLTMHVGLGREPEGEKRESGDLRTPEGAYAIAGPARASRFHLFIPIDYPSPIDAARAFADGRVDRATYEQIVDAHEQGLLPPQNSPLGGYIGLHGEGESWQGDSAHVDWTLGCVAMTDGEIEQLAERIQAGVPVWIHP